MPVLRQTPATWLWKSLSTFRRSSETKHRWALLKIDEPFPQGAQWILHLTESQVFMGKPSYTAHLQYTVNILLMSLSTANMFIPDKLMFG